MDEPAPQSKFHLSKFGWVWFCGLAVCASVGWILEWFDHSTELTPVYSGALNFSFVAAGVIAVISAGIMIWQSEGPNLARFTMSIVVAPAFSIIGVVLLINEIATLIEQKKDFPPAKTRTFQGLLLIDRAYQTHGKGRSWNIQTMPIWSNLTITRADYNHMLANRSPHDAGNDPDEITSDGYFCAHVTLQQSGQALRVLNAGTYALPEGTVSTCSTLMAADPTLVVIR